MIKTSKFENMEK